TEHEAPAREALQVPGHLGRDEGTSGKRDCDARADARPARMLGQNHLRQVGIVPSLGHEDRVVAELIELPCMLRERFDGRRSSDGRFDFHERAFWEIYGLLCFLRSRAVSKRLA